MSARVRIGAYVLAADPTWLRSSLERYYDQLDVLLVSASHSNRGWSGKPVAADACIALAESLDARGIVRVRRDGWFDADAPMRAETAQRQAAIDEVGSEVDWVIQIDSDEVLPNFGSLRAVLKEAAELGVDAVDWPMRVLYRRLPDGRYLEVRSEKGGPRYEYPGPIAVRPGVTLVDARRTDSGFVRAVVRGDAESVQLQRPPEPTERRLEVLDEGDAILHNSWARTPRAVRAKIASWGHNQGLRSQLYYYGVWLPTPLRWRRMKNFHPFAPYLWPRLGISDADIARYLHPDDQDAQTKRLA